mgnify:CR=1 FL=1
MFVGWVWLNIIGMIGYLFVILAMVYGWGMKPVSWFWVIVFYFIATHSWFVTVMFRIWMRDKFKKGKNID